MKYSDHQILFEFDYLTSKFKIIMIDTLLIKFSPLPSEIILSSFILANPNNHDGDHYLKQNPVIIIVMFFLILANDCDDQ